jgi:cell division septum initiation protein DivIVA
MDRDAILNRVKQLRDEIEFLVREIQEYESGTFHSIQDQTVHAVRMQRLAEIKRDLDEIKAGEF